MRRLLSAFVLTALAFAGGATAQVSPGEFGFTVQSSAGTAGTFCRGFTCTPFRLAVAQQDTLLLTVRAELRSPFAIAISPALGRCQSIPGVDNQLILLPSTTETLVVDRIGSPSPILACWSGFESVRLALPPRLPAGAVFHLQALVAGPSPRGRIAPAFTSAVSCGVR